MQSWDAHMELAERLNQTTCKWILSSFDIPEMRNLYGKEKNHFIPLQAFSGMKKEKNGSERVLNKEVLITNFIPAGYAIQTSERPGQLRLLAENDAEYLAPR
jgi:hypothetical protein